MGHWTVLGGKFAAGIHLGAGVGARVWLDGWVSLGKVIVFDPCVLARVLDYNKSG